MVGEQLEKQAAQMRGGGVERRLDAEVGTRMLRRGELDSARAAATRAAAGAAGAGGAHGNRTRSVSVDWRQEDFNWNG